MKLIYQTLNKGMYSPECFRPIEEKAYRKFSHQAILPFIVDVFYNIHGDIGNSGYEYNVWDFIYEVTAL